MKPLYLIIVFVLLSHYLFAQIPNVYSSGINNSNGACLTNVNGVGNTVSIHNVMQANDDLLKRIEKEIKADSKKADLLKPIYNEILNNQKALTLLQVEIMNSVDKSADRVIDTLVILFRSFFTTNYSLAQKDSSLVNPLNSNIYAGIAGISCSDSTYLVTNPLNNDVILKSHKDSTVILDYTLYDKTEGLRLFKTNTGKFGFINTIGDVVIKPIYDTAANFSCGAALVKIGKEYFFINKQGKLYFKIPLNYNTARSFAENGLAVIGKEYYNQALERNYNYISIVKAKQGIIKPEFDGYFSDASDFKNDVAVVSKPIYGNEIKKYYPKNNFTTTAIDNYFLINNQGKIIVNLDTLLIDISRNSDVSWAYSEYGYDYYGYGYYYQATFFKTYNVFLFGNKDNRLIIYCLYSIDDTVSTLKNTERILIYDWQRNGFIINYYDDYDGVSMLNDSLLMLSKKVNDIKKYGVFNSDGLQIIPCIYDTIIFDGKYLTAINRNSDTTMYFSMAEFYIDVYTADGVLSVKEKGTGYKWETENIIQIRWFCRPQIGNIKRYFIDKNGIGKLIF